jgi:tetratricopeptide (TPR) repeat protein
MSSRDGFRWLFFLALFLAVMASSRSLPAESPAPPSQQASPQTPTQPAAAPQAVSTEPPPTPEQLGDTLARHQRYQDAIAAYSQMPHPSADVWNKMGIDYQLMYNLKEATRCYNASLKFNPRNASVLNNLATVYDSLKQYKTAERYYRKAVKSDPHSAMILRNLGSNQLSQHKYNKGWAAYKAALAIDPQIFVARAGASVENPASTQDRGAMHYFMARGCVAAGNSDCAIQNLRLALNEGYTSPKKIAGDNSFASLRELPAFQQLMVAQGGPQ